jgi:hypothetical protein
MFLNILRFNFLVLKKIGKNFTRTNSNMNRSNRSESPIEVKTEYFGNLSHDDDMMVLEIIAEKLIKILEKALDSINKYKSILPYLNEYNVKKGYLSILINTKDVLNQNDIADLKRKIVSYTYKKLRKNRRLSEV